MSSHWHNFGGRYGRGGIRTNWNDHFDQFQQHSAARQGMPLPFPRYYQGTSHFHDRMVQNNMMDQQMDTQEEVPVDLDHDGTWTTQSDAQEAVNFDGHGYKDYRQSGIGNVSHRPIWKRRGLGPFRGGFRRGGRANNPSFGRGNVRSFIRRQKDLQKKHEWTRLDHSLQGKGQDLKLDLGSDAAGNFLSFLFLLFEIKKN